MKEGVFYKNGKCYRVVRLFDECDTRREMATYEASKLYRGGEYLGDCMMMYEVNPIFCRG